MFADEIYISKKHKLEDYLGLSLNMNSSKITWERAINIFVSRIKERYFDAIDKLSDDGNFEEMFKYGFSIMTIECLLIDTFVKFRYGPNRINNGEYRTIEITDKYYNKSYNKLVYYRKNEARFIKFMKEFFIFGPENAIISKKFYKDIRCGIVHFGSTENTSRLTCDSSQLITILDNGDISVDVKIMHQMLKSYFNQYIKELKDSNQYELRKNFLMAMDYLCGIYEKNID